MLTDAQITTFTHDTESLVEAYQRLQQAYKTLQAHCIRLEQQNQRLSATQAAAKQALQRIVEELEMLDYQIVEKD
ncbi:MAG: hypothetical protein Tsb005_13060 [Gammaproteobacteria bacterium]